jgi:hypothetical protein
MPLPCADARVLRIAPTANVNLANCYIFPMGEGNSNSVDLVMTRVEQHLGQEEGHFREDALNGVEGGVVGGIERRAHGSVGAGQGGAQVWVAAAPVGVLAPFNPYRQTVSY